MTEPVPSPTSTLESVRRYIAENLDDGVRCPACSRHNKRYPRRFNSGMAAWLCVCVRIYLREQRPVNVSEIRLSRRGDPHFLAHWDLAHTHEVEQPAPTRTDGYWLPTERGFDFVLGRISIPSVAIIVNNEVEGFAGREITVQQALRRRFDYAELMGHQPDERGM